MLKINNILAPVAFDKESAVIARTAVQFANMFKAKLYFLHVDDPLAGTPSLVAGSLHTKSHTKEDLKNEIARHVPPEFLTLVHTSYRIEKGEAVDKIVEFAKSKNIDLIVIGNPSEGSFARLFFTPVEDGVIQHAPCDIYAVCFKDD